MCFCFQPLKYASSASLYQQQDGSPALTASTQTGVNSKVSAWLQQTHDIDATSNGAFIDCTQVTECVNVLRDLKEGVCLNTFVTFCVSELARCQLELTELAQLIQRLHWLEGGLPITSTDLEMRISMHVSIKYIGFKSNLCSFCSQLLHPQSFKFPVQNLTLTKPKKKTGKVFGHSRTLSRVEDLGVMVVKHLNLTQCLNFHLSS